jgi:hypothetical protein
MSKKSLIASESLTVEQIKQASPARCRSNITPELVDRVNQLIADPEERERYQENFLGYLDVLKDPKFSLNKYIDAVRYVGYKLAGSTNQEAYTKTFPDRVQGMLDRGKDGGHIRAIVSAYNSGQLVNAILEQALIPTWVRVQAANSILTHLKQPESSKVTLDVNVAEDETVKELRRAVTDLAREQQAAIERGSRTVIDIAEGDLIEGESERVDD